MPRVYILGAGASRFASYPLGLDLWSFVRDSPTPSLRAKQIAPHVIGAMDRILKILPPKEPARPNLEEIFTLLDLVDQGSQILEAADVRWGVVRECVIAMITEAFLWHEYQFERGAP